MKVPTKGVVDEYFKLSKRHIESSNTNLLPIAHTCGKTLDIPEYSSREILKLKLQMAITDGSNGFFIN